MKKWENPNLISLGINSTNTESDYVTVCNWDGISTYGMGNEEYTNPNKKPDQHEDWVWCQVHGRWHEKDHTSQVGRS